MLLDLSEEHKEHLAFLPRVDSAVVAEFGRIAVEFLRRGANPKIYEGAARKLSVSTDTVQHGVEGLTYLLTESSKLLISELDFQDSVFVLGFSEELNKLLLQLYLDNRKEIRTILSELAPDLPSYHSLEWRLDVQNIFIPPRRNTRLSAVTAFPPPCSPSQPLIHFLWICLFRPFHDAVFLAMRLPPGAQELAQEMAGTETALIQPECGEVVEERHQMRGSASGREGEP
ncbi:COMM domain-containing protein 2 isoform X1 [Equus przewalskii]|uniref:COMM domain containing 2 n=2 Tax=Equus TaxID=9789 RepID=A0A9L0RT75_HORSE|nr:COMM domain-containing protein 2 isoform X2 [Equus caballus]